MNDNWGLTERGFLRPSYADLLDAFEVKAKELFGSTVNLSVRSPLGIFLRIFAWFAGLTWQLAEDVYEVTTDRYREGIASMTEVLQDEMRMSEAQNNYINAHYNYRVTNLALLKLTGQTESLLK